MDSDEYNDDGQCTIERADVKPLANRDRKETKETSPADLSGQPAGGQQSGASAADSSSPAALRSAGDSVGESAPDDSEENARNREIGTPDHQLNAPAGSNVPANSLNVPEPRNAGDHGQPENASPVDRPASQIIDDNSSTTSSTHPPVAAIFKPSYVIAVLPSELEFDEYSVYYVIKAIAIGKSSDSRSDLRANRKEAPEEMIVKREFDDFLYLNHVLVNSGGFIFIKILNLSLFLYPSVFISFCSSSPTAYPGYGLIVPPLPNKPKLDDIYLTTQELLFNRNAFLTNLLYDEQYQKECWMLEQYLHAMLNHSTFGKDPFWDRFLMINEQPPKIKLKKNSNLLSSLFAGSDSQESMFATSKPNRMMHRDCDDYFQR